MILTAVLTIAGAILAFVYVGKWSEVLAIWERTSRTSRTSTGSEAFFLFICLDANKFSLQTFFSL